MEKETNGDISAPPKGKSKKVDPIRSREDVERVRVYLRDNFRHGDMYACMWTFGCNMGLRAGDLRRVTSGDIRGRAWFDFQEQKTSKMRRIFINEKVRDAYADFVKKYVFIDDASELFSCQKGFPVEIKHVHKMIKSACRELEIDGNFGSHTMRKTFAYHAFRAEPTRQRLELIRTAFGHASTYITRVYTGFTADEVDGESTEVGEIKDIYIGLDL